jgi:ABC-type nitrate/sulfonate/bicarbonate transport system permease component
MPETRSAELLAGFAGVAGLLLLWELSARFIWQDPQTLPAPTQALAQAMTVLTPQRLAEHVGISLFRIFAGFSLAALAGITLGILCGWSRWAVAVVRPFIEILRPIPPLAWIPIAIIWFGLGEGSKIFVIFLGAFFPIFTSAWSGAAMVPKVLLSAAETMDVRGARLLVKVVVPAALPDMATGLRVGFGLSFGILVAAELIAAQSGMGYLVMQSRQLGQLGISIFGIFLIGIVALAVDHQFGVLTRKTIGRWSSI